MDAIERARRIKAELIAQFTNTPYECALNGHNVETIRSGYLYFQKDEQPVRYFFDGEYEFCTRKNCPMGLFRGDLMPHKIDRIEDPIKNENEGVQYGSQS